MQPGEAIPTSTDIAAVQGGLLALMPDLQCALDGAGNVQFVNPALADAMGHSPADLLGRPLRAVAPAESGPGLLHHAERARQSGQVTEWLAAWNSAGDRRELAWRAVLQPETDLVLAVARDVTESRRSEEALRANQRLLRAVFDTLPHSLFVKDRHSNYVMGNATWARRNGCSVDEMVGRNTLDVTKRPLAEREESVALDRKLFAGGHDLMASEFVRTGPTGARLVIRNWRSVLRDDAGAVIGLVGISEDVTEQRQAEQAWRESERRFRDLIEGSIQGIVILRGRKPLFANAAYARMFGHESPAEILALDSIDRLVAPEDLERQTELGRSRLRGEQVPEHYEFQGVRRDGQRIWVDCMAKLVEWDGDAAIQVTLQDVSARKEVIEQLQRSERLLQTVFDTVPYLIFVKDRDGNYLMTNAAWIRETGGDPAESIGRNTLELEHRPRADRESALDCDQQVLHAGRIMEFEYDRTRPDGSRCTYRNFRAPLRDGAGDIVGIVGISEDVTAQRKAEEELRAGQRLLRLVIDTLPHIIFLKSLDGRYLMVNRAMEEFHGLRQEQLPHATADDLVGATPEQVAFIRETDRRVIAENRTLEWPDVHITLADGTTNIHRMFKTPVHDDAGRVQGIVCVSENLTERRRAEEELEASQRLLRVVIDSLPQNIYVKDLEGRYLLVNRAMAEFQGVALDEMVGKCIHDLPGPPQALRDLLLDTDRQVIESGEMRSWPELPVAGANGQMTIRRLHKQPLRDGEGRIQGVVGISEDITLQKRIEEELRASHRMLRTVIDTVPNLLAVKDTERRYLLVNRAWEKHTGMRADEAIGQTMESLGRRTEVEIAAIRRMDDAILSGSRSALAEEFARLLPDGTALHFLNFRAPLLDDSQAVVGVVGVAVDITGLERTQEELRASRQLLQTVFDAMPLWLFVKDRQRKFVMMNRRMAEDHGLEQRNVLSDSPADVSTGRTESERRLLDELDGRVLEKGEHIDLPRIELTLNNGQTRRYRTVRVPLRDAAGAIKGVVGITEDITEQERAEQAVQQAQKLESLGVLAGGIAHDFNNLLVSVLGYADLATRELAPDSLVLPWVRQIETAGRRASELCKQMLAYAGKASFRVSRVQLNGLIREMTELIRVSLSRNIRLRLEFDEFLPEVEVDPTQLRQVVMNLLINASEAIGERGGSITMRTGLHTVDAETLEQFVAEPHLLAGRYVALEVTDTGGGMDPETLARIFDPFFTTKFSGRGLGLAAVLGIVRGHRGALRVTSSAEVGTTFLILLPPAPASTTRTERQAIAADGLHGSGHVLVVDDEVSIRELLRSFLERWGFRVSVAASGEEALLRVRDGHDDLRLVLMDVTMPGLSCKDTLLGMVQAGLCAPVVLMSGHAEQEVRANFGDLPVADFLSKPFRGGELQATLEPFLRDDP